MPKLLVAAATAAALAACAPQPRTITFNPPYPERNADGEPILAVYHGRIPCEVANCDKRKVSLVLYEGKGAKAHATYWLGVVAVDGGNDRIVTQGAWRARRGVVGYPTATVYELDEATPADLRYYWRVNEDILLPLQRGNPKVGNAAWGYMLSRDRDPYGPKTYLQ